MRKLYQTAWLGINFRKSFALDSNKIADEDFYDKFYRELFRRYSTYDEFPANWRRNKTAVADFILSETNPQDRLLSIGCGSGYVEVLLSEAYRDITAIEPSHEATRLLARYPAVKLISGFFPGCLQSAERPAYDVACLNAVDYCLAEDGLAALLRQIYDYPVDKLILISVSSYNKYALGRGFKDFVKELLRLLHLYHPGQFWGYRRTRQELTRAVREAGYHEVQCGFIGAGNLWVKGRRG